MNYKECKEFKGIRKETLFFLPNDFRGKSNVNLDDEQHFFLFDLQIVLHYSYNLGRH